MRQIRFAQPGSPAEVVECVDVAEPHLSEPDGVLVGIDLFPINPADLLTLQGYYPRTDPDARTLGVEALGVVEAVGSGVTELTVGDRVILLCGENWVERKVVKSDETIRVAMDADRFTSATLKVNPATAALLLSCFVALKPGDWIIQNAATSSVGRAVIRMAADRGLRTVNLVRRLEAAPELEALGADIVLADVEGLPERVIRATVGVAPRLALDGVAGDATDRLAACLAPGATLVVYGAMSGEAVALNPGSLVFRDVVARGFWLTRHLETAPRSEIMQLYADVQQALARAPASAKVAAVYRADEIKAAVAHAVEAGSGAKVFVTFGSDTSGDRAQA